MASPHVAGLALALIAKDPNGCNTPAKVTSAICGLARKNSRVVPPLPAGTTTLISCNGL